MCHRAWKDKTGSNETVTIKAIAKAVGVSSATVSRVLNYDPALSISPVKRQAIIETAEALNYEMPRNGTRPMATPRPACSPGWRSSISSSHRTKSPIPIMSACGSASRTAVATETEIVKVFHSDALPEASLLSGASGVIVIGKHSGTEIAWFREHDQHVVMADFDPKIDTLDSVFSDVGAAMVKIPNALKASGHKRIGFIGSHEHLNGETLYFGERRCAAYIEWQKANDTFDRDLLALGSNPNGQNLRLETGCRLAQSLLDLDKRPDVIITATTIWRSAPIARRRNAGSPSLAIFRSSRLTTFRSRNFSPRL